MIFLLFMSLLFMCNKINLFSKKYDIIVILVDLYVNFPRYFATRIRFAEMKRIRSGLDPQH